MSRNWILTAPATAAARIILRTWAREPAPTTTPALELDPIQPSPTRHPIRLNPGQTGAAQWARRTLEQFRGAIIADAVGTGKTFIALELVHDAIRNDHHILITTPAAIRPQWLQLLQPPPPRVSLWSHTSLHRRNPNTPFDFIVVDEAHAFRNPRTRRHIALARLSHNARLLLLTATPVNNSLWDVYFLIRLFATDSAFAPLGTPSMRLAFTAATATRQPGGRTRKPSHASPHLMETGRIGPAAAGLDRILDAVLLQRSRTGAAHDARFPDRAPPEPIHYNLDDASPHLLHDLLHGINTLQLCPYNNPPDSRNNSRQNRAGTDALIRLGLLKRLESSLTAFSYSLRKLETFFAAFLHELQNGFLLEPHVHHALHAADPDRSFQLILSQLLLPATTSDSATTLHSIDQDLATIRQLRDRIQSASHDPKTTRLTSLLDQLPGDRRTIVFTEFVHTARALELALLGKGDIARIDGDSASINGQPTSRNRILQQFAPPSHPSRLEPHHNTVRTLICTDVLAEGLNLQMADTAIAYDLPWNPVRLIQRFGRIDRRDSPHASIHLAFFTPDKGLDDILDLLDRIRAKLHAARITTPDSIDPDLLRRFTTRPATTSVQPPTTTTSRDFLISLARSAPAAPASATPAASTCATTHTQTALVALVTSATTTFLITSQHRRCDSPSTRHVTSILHTALTSTRPDNCHSNAQTLPLARLAAATAIRYIRRLSRRNRTRSPLTPALTGTVSTAIRKLLASTATIPGGPDDETTGRIDSLIRILSKGLRTHRELQLLDWLRSHQPTTLDQLRTAITSLETLLEITGDTTTNDNDPDTASRRVRVVAVLLLD
jgi:superfamily II DNA or RNA helicase